MRVRIIFLLGLIYCLGVSGSVELAAQTADRAQRIDRITTARDRAATRTRDRVIDRDVASRTVDRVAIEPIDEPERTTDTREEVMAAEASEAGGIILIEERGYRYRRGEVLALNLSDAAAQFAREAGLSIARQRHLDDGNILTVLRGNAFDNPAAMIAEMKAHDPDGVYAPNHVFGASGAPELTSVAVEGDVPTPQNLSENNYRIGMIDGMPDQTNQRLDGFLLDVRQFTGGPGRISSHGTAVALRMRETQMEFAPDLPLRLYAADVLAGEGDVWASADAIAAAIAWQRALGVDVLNISLAGPPNEIVEMMILAYQGDGGVVVAAVGNGGPLSGDIYPAAYPGVLGVTAVDVEGALFAYATQGAHVDFAAPGVDLKIAGLETLSPISGTSFAAPFAAVWVLVVGFDGQDWAATCADLGPIGRDDKYGWGELGWPRLTAVSHK